MPCLRSYLAGEWNHLLSGFFLASVWVVREPQGQEHSPDPPGGANPQGRCRHGPSDVPKSGGWSPGQQAWRVPHLSSLSLPFNHQLLWSARHF